MSLVASRKLATPAHFVSLSVTTKKMVGNIDTRSLIRSGGFLFGSTVDKTFNNDRSSIGVTVSNVSNGVNSPSMKLTIHSE
jgi:hypothetical protein